MDEFECHTHSFEVKLLGEILGEANQSASSAGYEARLINHSREAFVSRSLALRSRRKFSYQNWLIVRNAFSTARVAIVLQGEHFRINWKK